MLVKCVSVVGHDGVEQNKGEKGRCKSTVSEMMQPEETKACSSLWHVRVGAIFKGKGSTEEERHLHDCL